MSRHRNKQRLQLLHKYRLTYRYLEWISYNPFLSSLDRFLYKLLIHLFLNQYPGSSTTALTHIEEQTKVSNLNSLIYIRILVKYCIIRILVKYCIFRILVKYCNIRILVKYCIISILVKYLLSAS